MAKRPEPCGAELHCLLDDCPILPDVTHILTLLGLILTPPTLIGAAGVALSPLMGNPVAPVWWVLIAGALACAGAAVWSHRRCKGLGWNLPVQAGLAAASAAAGVIALCMTDDRLLISLAAMLFYPAVLLVLHGLWSMLTRRVQHGK